MKGQSLFSGGWRGGSAGEGRKKYISLSSADFVHKVVKVNFFIGTLFDSIGNSNLNFLQKKLI